MYIVQMADLHIGSEIKCFENEDVILSKGIECIKMNIPKGEKILVCVCGDIIDSKKPSTGKRIAVRERYAEAAQLFRLMLKELRDEYEVRFRFCIGNHDVTHIGEFTKFVAEFDAEVTKDRLENGYFMKWDETYYVFLNSCNGRQYEYGCIDYSKVEQLLEKLPRETRKIFVLHHTSMSMFDDDKSAIRDLPGLLKIIEKNNVVGVLHGHIHGKEQFWLSYKRCRMIGVGALFSRNFQNVNSQFNVIEINPFVFKEISTYIYRADDRISGNSWLKLSSEGEIDENYFQGSCFGDVYTKLMSKLTYKKVLNNVTLHIKSTYADFRKTLENYFEEDVLVIGRKHFAYPELAQLWEETEVPDNLYFNHGEYFCVENSEKKSKETVHGIQVIANQLKEKPTSNKAVLTTYSMDTVTRMLKGEEYLPSLLSVQFSQSEDKNTIYVHMYLRALEAGRFLKINICEVKWMLEQLEEYGVFSDNVDIAISAFRVQKRDAFSCFLKADIDMKSEAELALDVYRGNIEDICQMLEEKKDASETITNANGIKSLCSAMKINNEKDPIHEYNPVVIEKLNKILEVYEKLDKIHKKGSIKTQEEEQYEKEIHKGIEKIVNELKKGGSS